MMSLGFQRKSQKCVTEVLRATRQAEPLIRYSFEWIFPSARPQALGKLADKANVFAPPAASLFSPAFGALGSKPGTKGLPGAH